MGFEFNSAEALDSAPQSTQAPEATNESPVQAVSQGQAEAPTSAEQAILDLASVQKFKFQDREWTPKDLQSAIMMQSDYTKKTQALAEERKYSSNFAADMQALIQNPSLFDSFKSIYPEQYWAAAQAILDRATSGNQTQPNVAQQVMGQQMQAGGNLPPEYRAALDRLQKLEQRMEKQFTPVVKDFEERSQKAVDAELDAVYKSNLSQYPHADEGLVTMWAQGLIGKGVEMTPDVWGKLFKKAHEDAVSRSDRIYAEKQKQQQTVSKKAFAGAPGGATPGQAPKLPKTIKEATRMMIESGELN